MDRLVKCEKQENNQFQSTGKQVKQKKNKKKVNFKAILQMNILFGCFNIQFNSL